MQPRRLSALALLAGLVPLAFVGAFHAWDSRPIAVAPAAASALLGLGAVAFAATRRGVEAFVEPKTAVTETTLLLVASDGEWTRRVVPSPEWAHAFAEHLKIPGYDAAVVGYPQRMRDYNSRNKKHPDLR